MSAIVWAMMGISIWPVPGALAGLALAYAYGAHRERKETGESE